MMFDPSDRRRRPPPLLYPAGLWAASPAVGGCPADGRGLWDESYVASCVHDLHIQAAAANQSHFIDVAR